MVSYKSGEDRYLIFVLNDENYAVMLEKVREVIALSTLTSVPNTPAYFKGILNLRGQVIAIIGMRNKLKMPDIEPTYEGAIIILDHSPSPVGIIVDSVSSVLTLSQDHISSPPEMGTKGEDNFTGGIARVGKSLIVLLDLGLILGHQVSMIDSFDGENLLKSA